MICSVLPIDFFWKAMVVLPRMIILFIKAGHSKCVTHGERKLKKMGRGFASSPLQHQWKINKIV